MKASLVYYTMNIWNCEQCNEYFNTRQRVPRFLMCGHTFCSVCLESLLENGSITCPTDKQVFTVYNSTENIAINQSIFTCLKHSELTCSFHENSLAVRINLQKASTYCENCSMEDSSPIYYEDLKETLVKALENYLSLPEISEEYKKIIVEKCMRNERKIVTNMERLELLQKLKFMSTTIFCDKHESKKAEFMNFISKEVLCESCITRDVHNFESMSNENFYSIFVKKILWVRRSVNKLKSILNCDYNELVSKSLKSLVIGYQSLPNSLIQAPVILIDVKCKVCGSVYSAENEPWIFPCIGGHTICSNCISGKESISCPYCVSNESKYHNSTLDLLYSFENRVTYCPFCKKPYNLKENIPKELPCGHNICLKCLKLNYLDVYPNVNKCISCSASISNLKCLPNCKFLINQVKKTLIFCSKHRNRTASCIEVLSLMSWCSECESTCLKNLSLFRIHEEKITLAHFLLTIFTQNLKLPPFYSKSSINEFKKLSSQEMLDEIRAGKEPQTKHQLLSDVPKGREIKDSEYSNDKCLLLRFMSLLPPRCHDPEFEYICRPWRVECDKNQVEAVSFKSNRNIKLEGIIISQCIYNTLVSVEKLEIIVGQSLESTHPRLFSSQILVDLNRHQYEGLIGIDNLNLEANTQGLHIEFLPNLNENEIAFARFGSSVSLAAGEYYSILLKLKGEKVILFKGNPFDLKEEFWGSDGTLFHFSSVTNKGEHYIEGQHSLTGPILGLIYE